MKHYYLIFLLLTGCGKSITTHKCMNAILPVKEIPITFYVDLSGQPYLNEINRAAEIWNNSTNLPLIIVQDARGCVPKAPEGINTIRFVDTLPYIENGRTTFYTDYYNILDSDIQIAYPLKTDAISVLLHEMGHSLGLDHNINEDSIMHEWMSKYDIKHIPTKEDVDAIMCLYD